MAALDTISGFVTAPGAAFTAVTFSNGTGTIRNFNQGNAYLVTLWTQGNTSAGYTRVLSPRLHDNVNGITVRWDAATAAGNTLVTSAPTVFTQWQQPLVAQDTLAFSILGSAVAGDIINFSALIYYDYLVGSVGNFIGEKELDARAKNMTTLIISNTGGTTGAWSAGVALSAATFGTLKANTNYALVGYSYSETAPGNCASFAIQGVDTGNLFIGMPAVKEYSITSEWFTRLGRAMASDIANPFPIIPVINSANAGGTLVYNLNNENANTTLISLQLVELS